MERFGRVVALLVLAAACFQFLFIDSGHPHVVRIARVAFLLGFAALVFLRALALRHAKPQAHKPLP